MLQGFSGTHDRYLFLNVKQGNDYIIELHDKLYEGILAKYLYRKLPYIPHITVGYFNNEPALDEALEQTKLLMDCFETDVSEIAVEIIDQHEQSNIEFVIAF